MVQAASDAPLTTAGANQKAPSHHMRTIIGGPKGAPGPGTYLGAGCAPWDPAPRQPCVEADGGPPPLGSLPVAQGLQRMAATATPAPHAPSYFSTKGPAAVPLPVGPGPSLGTHQPSGSAAPAPAFSHQWTPQGMAAGGGSGSQALPLAPEEGRPSTSSKGNFAHPTAAPPPPQPPSWQLLHQHPWAAPHPAPPAPHYPHYPGPAHHPGAASGWAGPASGAGMGWPAGGAGVASSWPPHFSSSMLGSSTGTGGPAQHGPGPWALAPGAPMAGYSPYPGPFVASSSTPGGSPMGYSQGNGPAGQAAPAHALPSPPWLVGPPRGYGPPPVVVGPWANPAPLPMEAPQAVDGSWMWHWAVGAPPGTAGPFGHAAAGDLPSIRDGAQGQGRGGSNSTTTHSGAPEGPHALSGGAPPGAPTGTARRAASGVGGKRAGWAEGASAPSQRRRLSNSPPLPVADQPLEGTAVGSRAPASPKAEPLAGRVHDNHDGDDDGGAPCSDCGARTDAACTCQWSGHSDDDGGGWLTSRPGGKGGRVAGPSPSILAPTGASWLLPRAAPVVEPIPEEEAVEGRRFPCPLEGCTALFHNKHGLARHWRSHTGEKPFPCRYPGCDKAYAHRPGLNYHIAAVHTGARPYQCTSPGCTASFPGASALKVHMQSTRYHARVALQHAAAQAAAAAGTSLKVLPMPGPATQAAGGSAGPGFGPPSAFYGEAEGGGSSDGAVLLNGDRAGGRVGAASV